MSNITPGELVMLFLTITILFAINRYFTRLFNEVKKLNRYMEAQVKLLAESAVKNGVEVETVSNITAQAGIDKIKL